MKQSNMSETKLTPEEYDILVETIVGLLRKSDPDAKILVTALAFELLRDIGKFTPDERR
jgi:hypothetical protein